MSKYLIIAALIITGTFFSGVEKVAAAFDIPSGGVELTGFAWSGTVGWISMNCSNTGTCSTSDYQVTLRDDGNLSGYAWSSNVGWIRFDAAGSYPATSDVIPESARRIAGTYPNVSFGGWARVCSVTTNPATCQGAAIATAGGWDGWISLGSNPTASVPYGVTMSAAGATASSYAWGGPVVMGWIDFSPAGATPVVFDVTPPVVSFSCPGDPVANGSPVTCTYDPNGGGGDPADVCTLTSDAGDNTNVPATAGTITVNPTVTTTYTLVCSTVGVPSTPQVQTIEVRPDILIVNPSVDLGPQNPTTGAYNWVDVEYGISGIPNGQVVNTEVNLGSVDQTPTITGTGVLQQTSVRFNNVPFSGTPAVYTIEVDDSPNTGAVPEDVAPLNPGASSANNEDYNYFEGTQILRAPDPQITVTVPEIVPTGTEVDVEVTVRALYDTTCQVFGPGFSAPASQFTVSAGVEYSDTFTSAPLTNSTNVAVRCDVPGAPQFSVSSSVEVTPAFQEV